MQPRDITPSDTPSGVESEVETLRQRWGRAIRQQRQVRKMKQSELAEALTAAGWPTTQAAVSQWEGGRRAPAPDRQPAIARVLGCDPAALFAHPDLDAA